MKKTSLIDKLHRFFDKKRKHQEAQLDQLKALLKKLKRQEVALRGKMEQSDDATRREHVERQLEVLHEQRKKGIALRQELNKAIKHAKKA